ncbi:MAG TPA: hypothetical protein VE685_20820 [Thermoanaerobaculia bacterium]|nr:hypothetical protein [Thermoanaerobaculia bacterium]
MPFEVFSKRSAGKMKLPTITVQKRGTLSVNASAAAFLAGGEIPDKELPVELLFDRELNVLGLRRAQSDHPSVYMLRKQQKSDSFLLAGKAFTAYYGIPTGEARRYVAKDFGDGILGAELGGDYTDASREESDVDEVAPASEVIPEPVRTVNQASKEPAEPTKKGKQLPLPPPAKFRGR